MFLLFFTLLGIAIAKKVSIITRIKSNLIAPRDGIRDVRCVNQLIVNSKYRLKDKEFILVHNLPLFRLYHYFLIQAISITLHSGYIIVLYSSCIIVLYSRCIIDFAFKMYHKLCIQDVSMALYSSYIINFAFKLYHKLCIQGCIVN